MSDELDLEFELTKLIDEGSDDNKFTFIVKNVFALCETMDICPHCVASEILNHMEETENETCH